MELILKEQDGVDRGFVNYLITRIIPERFLSLLNRDKLKKWDEYFFTENKSGLNLGSFKRTKDIVEYGIKNLSISSYNGYYTISISPVVYIKGTGTKISQVCRLINYGNAEISGYMIFSDTFSTVKKELKLYQNMYSMGIF